MSNMFEQTEWKNLTSEEQDNFKKMFNRKSQHIKNIHGSISSDGAS